jgi:hypothetical protein
MIRTGDTVIVDGDTGKVWIKRTDREQAAAVAAP